MGSQSREVRLRQKERFEKELEARLAALAAKGLEKKAVDRDPTVRRLKADVAKSTKRLAAIDAREALAKELSERKAAKAAAPKEPKKKGAKKAEAAPKKGGEGKKKKEKEKEKKG